MKKELFTFMLPIRPNENIKRTGPLRSHFPHSGRTDRTLQLGLLCFMENVEECWRPVPELETIFETSTFGRIRSLSRVIERPYKKIFVRTHVFKGKVLSPIKDKDGYLVVSGRYNGLQKLLKVHRLVAQTFIPNPENKPQVNHKNGVKSDNMVVNLEWATNSENVKHAFRSGLKVNRKGVDDLRSVPVSQFTMDGVLVRNWEAYCQIHRETGWHRHHISACTKGRKKCAYGYIWRFTQSL